MTKEEFAKPLILGNQKFLPGECGVADLPIGHLITHELIGLQVHVIRGRRPGPRLFVTAGVHGDEINGVQIARNLIRSKSIRGIRGDLLVIPVVNQPAFVARSRYLPDRRDLNRLFPGSSTGSFGSRLARILTDEIIQQCTHGIDLHTGALYRPNLPQVRLSSEFEEAMQMAKIFNAPVIIDSPIREGSLRGTMAALGKPVILYEAGEANMMDRASVRMGTQGVLRVMRFLEMISSKKTGRTETKTPTVIVRRSTWIRAPRGGILMPQLELGKAVSKGAILGMVGDPFGKEDTAVVSEYDGIVIGRAKAALVDEGDGIFHIGFSKNPDGAEEKITRNETELEESFDRPVFDELD